MAHIRDCIFEPIMVRRLEILHCMGNSLPHLPFLLTHSREFKLLFLLREEMVFETLLWGHSLHWQVKTNEIKELHILQIR
jgi:hypothetical protein